MDVVLEVLDTFLFDPIYATLLPADATSSVSQYVKSMATTTFSSMRESSTGIVSPQKLWAYEPATHFFSIQPSHWAYESSLPRDNPYRQMISLYTITMYGIIYDRSKTRLLTAAASSVSFSTFSARGYPTGWYSTKALSSIPNF